MIIELNNTSGENVLVKGEVINNCFVLYDETFIENDWNKHWFILAHKETAIILLNQAGYLDQHKILINDKQMEMIAHGLNPKIFPDKDALTLFVRHGTEGQKTIADHITKLIYNVLNSVLDMKKAC